MKKRATAPSSERASSKRTNAKITSEPTVEDDDADELSSRSSGTEEAYRKCSKRSKTESKAVAPEDHAMDALDALPSVLPAAQYATWDTNGHMGILSFDELYKSYPMPGQELLANSHSRTAVEMKAQFDRMMEERRKMSTLESMFRAMLKGLPRPRFTVELFGDKVSHEQCLEMLRSNQLMLPEFTCKHESGLSFQAGSISMQTVVTIRGESKGRCQRDYNFPACMNGSECALSVHWKMIKNLTEPIVGTAMMFPSELELFKQHQLDHLGPRPCIFCYRERFSQVVMLLMTNPRIFKVKEGAVFNVYRNRYGCADGYFKTYMLLPGNTYQGFFCGLVAPRYDVLVAQKVYGRWYIDQSAMYFRLRPGSQGVAAIEQSPSVGQSLGDFNERVSVLRQPSLDGTAAVEWSKAVAMDPRDSLIRSHPEGCAPTLLETETQPGYDFMKAMRLFDRCWQICQFQTYEHHVTFDSLVSMVFDAMFGHVIRTGLTASIARARVYAVLSETVCEDTLQDMHSKFMRSCIWRRTSDSSDPTVRLFDKHLPQKCQKRMYDDAIRDYTETCPQQRKWLVDMFLCSMLRNYRHRVDPMKRMTLVERVYLLYIGGRFRDDLLRYIVSNAVIMQWIIRDYIIYTIRIHPSFEKHIRNTFNFTLFQEVTSATVDKIRDVFLADLMHGDRWKAPREDLRICINAVLHRMPAVVSQHCGWMHTVVDASNFPAPVTGWVSSGNVLSMYNSICAKSQKNILVFFYTRARNPILADFGSLCPQDLPDGTAVTVTPAHRKLMWDWIQHLDPLTVNFETDVLPKLLYFGVSSSALELVRQITQSYDVSRAGKKAVKQSVHLLAVKHSYAYALLRLFHAQWKMYTSVDTYPLPAYYAKYQHDAIRERLGLPEGAPVPSECSCLYFCWICKKIYSVVHRFAPPCKAHKRASCRSCEHMFMAGFNDIIVDIQKPHYLFCKRNHKPLSYLPPLERIQPAVALDDKHNTLLLFPSIIGRIMRIRDKMYLLCPQKACGKVMLFDPDQSAHNERGYACCLCTERIRQEEIEIKVTGIGEVRRCMVCPKNLERQSSKNIYVYPKGLFMCAKHHSERTKQLVVDLLDRSPGASAEDIANEVVNYRNAQKEAFKLVYKRRNAWQTQQDKRRTRAGRNSK
jgi:hypothetical protein